MEVSRLGHIIINNNRFVLHQLLCRAVSKILLDPFHEHRRHHHHYHHPPLILSRVKYPTINVNNNHNSIVNIVGMAMAVVEAAVVEVGMAPFWDSSTNPGRRRYRSNRGSTPLRIGTTTIVLCQLILWPDDGILKNDHRPRWERINDCHRLMMMIGPTLTRPWTRDSVMTMTRIPILSTKGACNKSMAVRRTNESHYSHPRVLARMNKMASDVNITTATSSNSNNMRYYWPHIVGREVIIGGLLRAVMRFSWWMR